jgi:hypothetical protein
MEFKVHGDDEKQEGAGTSGEKIREREASRVASQGQSR